VTDKLPIGQFVQKQQGGWNLQYTADEKYCARLVTNEVQFFESHNFSNVWNKLRVEGAANFALAPGSQNHAVAVFVPERKVSLFLDLPFLQTTYYPWISNTC
jgi:translation initiation factor 2A